MTILHIPSFAFTEIRGILTWTHILDWDAFCVMEDLLIINRMRNMSTERHIDLEVLHLWYPKCTKLYLGLQVMLAMTMTNGRNKQMFRKEKIQILSCILKEVAETIRNEVVMRQRKVNSMQRSQVTKTTISNMVFSARLRRKLCLRNIVIGDVKLFHLNSNSCLLLSFESGILYILFSFIMVKL